MHRNRNALQQVNMVAKKTWSQKRHGRKKGMVAKKFRGHCGPGRLLTNLSSLLDVQGNVVNHE
jgi:hypothetical protein